MIVCVIIEPGDGYRVKIRHSVGAQASIVSCFLLCEVDIGVPITLAAAAVMLYTRIASLVAPSPIWCGKMVAPTKLLCP